MVLIPVLVRWMAIAVFYMAAVCFACVSVYYVRVCIVDVHSVCLSKWSAPPHASEILHKFLWYQLLYHRLVVASLG